MKEILQLNPKIVWKYFYEILQIPRPSKKEEKIISFLEDFAKSHNLAYKKDSIGNILIQKPATPGKENIKSVVFQSHVDMVCEKNSDVTHDFDNDPINAYIDGGWIKAKGTTLGADNGIGIATQLALLAAKDIEHGPIECLFTVDEETGLTGATELDKDFFESKILINLDSEDEGEIFIGCAGGIDTLISYPLKYKKVSYKSSTYQIFIRGLKGGHSGDDINKGFANSNKLLTRLLWGISSEIKIQVADIQGGNLRNAIPREATAIICVKKKDEDNLFEYIENFENMIRKEFILTEPDLKIEIQSCAAVSHVVTDRCLSKLLNALYACPNGIIEISQTVPGLIETSTNLASVHFKEDRTVEIVTSQRSSIESAKRDIANSVKSTFELVGAKVWHTDSYPGWIPNKDSKILKIAESSYTELFNTPPKVKAIHAGLECGLFLEKYPYLDMLSIGPTIKGAHSPDERMEIETVDKFWQFTLEILKRIPG